MRSWLGWTLAMACGASAACADEHEYIAPVRSPSITPSDAEVDARMPVVQTGPWRPDLDAALLDDAGARDAALADARIPARDAGRDASVDAGTDAQADAGPAARDAGADAQPGNWTDASGERHAPVSLATDCVPATPSPAPRDDSCRDWPWHTPACYRAPSECAALRESVVCLVIDATRRSPTFIGLDTGATCPAVTFANYAFSAGNASLGQLGGDVLTSDKSVLVKRSLADGSFDEASQAINAAMVQGDRIVVQLVDGTLMRYPSWEDVKHATNGERVAISTTQAGAVFGANANAIVAAWPRGEVDMLLDDGAGRGSFPLQGYDVGVDGPIMGVDLSEDGKRLFASTREGIWTFDTGTGALLRRLRTGGLGGPFWGLSCSQGVPPGAEPPPLAGSPRPGFDYPDRTNPILTSPDCAGPFNGPRYYGQTAGPELLVIGNFFNGQSTVRDERQVPHILVLTSVQASGWDVTVADGAKLERIILNGAASPISVHSSTSVPVENHFDANSFGTQGGAWPNLDEAQLRTNLEQYTGRPVTELMGCHLPSSYVVQNVAPLCGTP